MTSESFPTQTPKSPERTHWKIRRAALEWDNYVNWCRGTNGFWIYKYRHKAILLFGTLLKATGFFKYGYRNARKIHVCYVDISPKALPEEFRGYRILHLSDLHLDSMEGLGMHIARTITPLSYDLCVITGDFRYARHGAYKQIIEPLRLVVEAARTATDDVYGVLGNHDTQAMREDIERLGLHLLTNESVSVVRNGQRMHIIGVDDPHDYFTEKAAECVKNSPRDGFRLLLAHSPELYDLASANGIQLYLCGHSHGGQICFPGGYPLITNLDQGKRFYRGLWRFRDMIGHTSPGCGTAKIPIRFNCRPEVTVLTLK